jgi:hypothetical protein
VKGGIEMALPIPNLDNLKFEELLEEAKSLIPVYAPEWTNYNLSDPGISLVEIFAWLSEMVNYRVDQVTEENQRSFLKLLGIHLDEGEKLESGIRRGVEQLSECYRAVTAKDFELLACKALMEKPGVRERYPDLTARAICLVNRNLEDNRINAVEQFAHISVILVMKTQNQKDLLREAFEIKKYVKEYLAMRKLLTTRIHVVDPDYQEVRIDLLVAAKDKELKNTIKEAVERYLDPINGGADSHGWLPGRNLYSSDLYYLVEGIPGIDHVIRVDLEAPSLKPHQLIKLKELIVEVEP